MEGTSVYRTQSPQSSKTPAGKSSLFFWRHDVFFHWDGGLPISQLYCLWGRGTSALPPHWPLCTEPGLIQEARPSIPAKEGGNCAKRFFPVHEETISWFFFERKFEASKVSPRDRRICRHLATTHPSPYLQPQIITSSLPKHKGIPKCRHESTGVVGYWGAGMFCPIKAHLRQYFQGK